MIGGDARAIESLEPCWAAMGKTFVRQGGPGAGQHAKMANQILIAANMIGVCEALLYAYKAGLDLNAVMQSVGGGAAGSWSLTNLGADHRRRFRPRLLRRAFHQGLGHCVGRSETDGALPARLGAGQPVVSFVGGARPRPRRHPGVASGLGGDVERRLAQTVVERDELGTDHFSAQTAECAIGGFDFSRRIRHNRESAAIPPAAAGRRLLFLIPNP